MTRRPPPGRGPPARPLRRPKRPRAPQGAKSSAVSPQALSLAVALLTAEHAGTGDTQADILGDAPRGPVIQALVMVSGAFLGCAFSSHGAEDALTAALRRLGLAMLEVDARTGGGP